MSGPAVPVPQVTVSHASSGADVGERRRRTAVPGTPSHGEHGLAADRDAVGEAEPFEAGAERRVRAVVGIDDDAGDREARLQDGPHLRQRDAPLLAKPHGRRDAGGRAPRAHRPSTTAGR